MGLFTSDIVAIDVGSYSVKGAVLNSKRELKKFTAMLTPPGAIEGGVIRDPERVTATIQSVWKALGVKDTNVISCVPGQHVFVRHITLPLMKKSELEQAVRFQAEGQIPIPPTDLVLDFWVTKEDKAHKQLEVLVVATRKSVVQQLVHIFNQAKLNPKVFDLESLALSRVLFKKGKKQPEGLDVIISIGAANTHISMFEGQVPRFTRSIPFGGQRFTKALAVERSISLEEAEERKLAGDLPEQVQSLMDDLSGEIKRSIDFFRSQNKAVMVRQLLLCGGGSQLNQLVEYLARRLEFPVVVVNPNEQIQIPKRLAQNANQEVFKTTFAPTLGMAVRGLK